MRVLTCVCVCMCVGARSSRYSRERLGFPRSVRYSHGRRGQRENTRTPFGKPRARGAGNRFSRYKRGPRRLAVQCAPQNRPLPVRRKLSGRRRRRHVVPVARFGRVGRADRRRPRVHQIHAARPEHGGSVAVAGDVQERPLGRGDHEN